MISRRKLRAIFAFQTPSRHNCGRGRAPRRKEGVKLSPPPTSGIPCPLLCMNTSSSPASGILAPLDSTITTPTSMVAAMPNTTLRPLFAGIATPARTLTGPRGRPVVPGATAPAAGPRSARRRPSRRRPRCWRAPARRAAQRHNGQEANAAISITRRS